MSQKILLVLLNAALMTDFQSKVSYHFDSLLLCALKIAHVGVGDPVGAAHRGVDLDADATVDGIVANIGCKGYE